MLARPAPAAVERAVAIVALEALGLSLEVIEDAREVARQVIRMDAVAPVGGGVHQLARQADGLHHALAVMDRVLLDVPVVHAFVDATHHGIVQLRKGEQLLLAALQALL